MKKIFVILMMILFLTGCGISTDNTKYEEVELTEDNIEDYIEVVSNRSNSSYGVSYRINIRSVDSSYKFENVKFDLDLIDCYYYDGMIVETLENIYITENGIRLNDEGEYSFNNSVSVSYKIKRLCSIDVWSLYDNVEGKVLIPY